MLEKFELRMAAQHDFALSEAGSAGTEVEKVVDVGRPDNAEAKKKQDFSTGKKTGKICQLKLKGSAMAGIRRPVSLGLLLAVWFSSNLLTWLVPSGPSTSDRTRLAGQPEHRGRTASKVLRMAVGGRAVDTQHHPLIETVEKIEYNYVREYCSNESYLVQMTLHFLKDRSNLLRFETSGV